MGTGLILENIRLFSPRTLRLSRRPATVVCRDGRIAEIFSGRRPTRNGTDNSINLKGAVLLPGLCDGHTHFADFALRLRRIDLRETQNPTDTFADIRAALPKFGAGEWIRGGGWHVDRHDGKLPTRQELDAITGDQPAALFSYCNHQVWVNSAALRLTGIDQNTPNPAGGEIVRDESGFPTGIFKETARGLLDQAIPRPSIPEITRAVKDGIAQMHAFGITSTSTSAIGLMEAKGTDEFLAYLALRDRGELNFRIRVWLGFSDLEFAVEAREKSDSLLSIWGNKFIADGTLGAQTALMFEPYIGTSNLGTEVIPFELLKEQVVEAARKGFPSAIHAIGDRANSNAIAAIEASRGINPNLRSRIEHVQILRSADMVRMAQLGIIASVQPCHLPDDISTADRTLGLRGRNTHATGAILRAGVRLAFGSDAPIETPNPMKGLFAATQRTRLDGTPYGGWHPEHRISLRQALRAFTWENAFVAGRENEEGDIKPGYLADLVAFRPDFFEMDPSELLQTSPLLTVFNGEVVLQYS